MPTAGFEPAIPQTERPQNHPLDRTATGISSHCGFGYEVIRNINCVTAFRMNIFCHRSAANLNLAPFVAPDTALNRKRDGSLYSPVLPVPVAARSEAWVCGLSRAGIAGSNLVVGMDVCLL